MKILVFATAFFIKNNQFLKMKKSKKTHETGNILGFSLFSKRKSELLKKIKIQLLSKNHLLTIFTPNAEQLAQAKQNPNFNQQLHLADILLPDGISLVWSSRLLSVFGKSAPIAERIAGIDLVKDLLDFCQEMKCQSLLIGGKNYQKLVKSSSPQVKGRVDDAGKYYQLAPQLFWSQGYEDVVNPTVQEEAQLNKLLTVLKPTIVFVAFGAPEQEAWVIKHQELLQQAQVKLVMVVGGAFDVILGRLSRAPSWMRSLGLEWLFRLIQEPWRWQRQTQLIKFVALVLKQAIAQEKTSS